MMKAEALLRTDSAETAAAIVTQVRKRAFADSSKAKVAGAELKQGSTYNYGWWEGGHLVNATGGEDIRYGRFLDELAWEFTMEGHRRQDLIRFGVFTTKMCLIISPVGLSYAFPHTTYGAEYKHKAGAESRVLSSGALLLMACKHRRTIFRIFACW